MPVKEKQLYLVHLVVIPNPAASFVDPGRLLQGTPAAEFFGQQSGTGMENRNLTQVHRKHARADTSKPQLSNRP
jgi:hypothetical protein